METEGGGLVSWVPMKHREKQSSLADPEVLLRWLGERFHHPLSPVRDRSSFSSFGWTLQMPHCGQRVTKGRLRWSPEWEQ